MKKVDSSYLEGPVPGMSLTSEPGARPWENPPVFVNVEDVVEFYTEQILEPDTEDFIVAVLDKGISIEAAASQVVSSGAMNGMHTMDVGFLVEPVVRELLMYVADSAGIEYVESYDKLEQAKRIPRSMARQIVQEIFSEEVAKKEEQKLPPQEPSQGLMARRPAAPMPAPAGMQSDAGVPTPTGLMSPTEGAGGMV
jgi:hypothetical protein